MMNLVPTGKRLGRRLELYAMTSSTRRVPVLGKNHAQLKLPHPGTSMCKSIDRFRRISGYPHYPQLPLPIPQNRPTSPPPPRRDRNQMDRVSTDFST
jgi:hypothetical protein